MRPGVVRSVLRSLPLRKRRYQIKLYLSVLLGYPFIPPRFASIIVTEKCNSRCNYCDYWRKSQPPQLSIEAFNQLCRQLQALGTREVVLSGGEPLLHKDIIHMVSAAKANGMDRVGIITNGLLLSRDMARNLVSAGLSWLELSLDSLNEETYAAQRGVQLRAIRKGLEALISLKQEYPLVGTSIHCVISKRNLRDIPELMDFAEESKLSIGFQPYHRSTYGNAEDALSGFDTGDEADVRRLCDYIIKRKQEGFVISSEGYLAGIPPFVITGRMLPIKCLTGLLHVVVDGSCSVRPCWSLPPIGQLDGKTDLRRIWFSPAFRKTRLEMSKLRCPGCWLNCHIEPSLPFQNLRG